MKKTITILALILTVGAKSQSLYFPPTTGDDWETVSPASLGWCEDKLDTLIQYVGATHAKAFMILKDGKIVVEQYYGTFTTDSAWYWASAGKTMAAFLVGLAQEQGYLNIQDSLPKYLGQGFSSCTPEAENAIRIIHQLTMTSGFDDEYGGYPNNPCTDDSCLTCLASPGTRWAYHNAPYTLTHAVIDSATHMSINTFKFINMNVQTGITGQFFPSGYDDVYWSKARSFARFGLLVSNRGIWDNDTIMHDTTYFHQMINTSQDINLAYGYLWWLNGKESYHLPTTQFQFSGFLEPDAPSDMIAALGKNDQILNIAPELGIVMIRMGDPMFEVYQVSNSANDSIWLRLNAAMCNTTAIQQPKAAGTLRLFPNPTSDFIHIKFDASPQAFQTVIFNALGQKVMYSYNQTTIDVAKLPCGLYMLTVASDNHIFTTPFQKL